MYRTFRNTFRIGERNQRILWSILIAAVGAIGPSTAFCTAEERQNLGWNHWRGPDQNGSSRETDLPDSLSGDEGNPLWTYPISGGGTPVVADERLYVFGYKGEGTALREILLCLDARSGETLWEKQFSDFLSDIVYDRYAIGAPVIDPETGNVYLLTSPGLLVAFTRDGEQLWERSMMEEFGRLTFPNGRTGSPSVEGDLVIIHAITANWGAHGPARDRFYAFDKRRGDLIWTSQPGVAPKDSSFSPVIFGWSAGKRVLFSGTGCGNIVCVDVHTGKPLWRYQMSWGGVNSAVVIDRSNRLIAIHGKENLDSTTIGRMIALKIPETLATGGKSPAVLGAEEELWRNELESFTSSPVIQGNRLFQTIRTGELCSVDLDSGRVLWSLKLSQDQLHASPVWGDGKLYLPMLDGRFYVIRPNDAEAEILSEVQLEGSCIGAPAIYGGRIFVLTKKKLYCFGAVAPPESLPMRTAPARVVSTEGQIHVVPSEFATQAGQRVTLRTVKIDQGSHLSNVEEKMIWTGLDPAVARMDEWGTLVTSDRFAWSTMRLMGNSTNVRGHTRGRILPSPPFKEGFESYPLSSTAPGGYSFAYPPPPWLGARVRWQILERDGDQVLANTLNRLLFQRSTTFIGLPEMSGYTLQADLLSEGNRRVLSNVGLINQRYNFSLIGNWQILEVVSNHDRVKSSVPFSWRADTWYRMKTRVDVTVDGSGVARAKVWQRDAPEPEAWTIEVRIAKVHRMGAPGLYAFSPQSLKRVYIDNITLTQNRPESDG